MSLKTFEEKLDFVEKHIKSFPDFPKEGILFRDLFSAISSGAVCKALSELLLEYVEKHFPGVEAVVGLEARGFLFCFPLAAQLEVACIPIRKKGKLPGKTIKYDYTLEYGTDTFEIQTDSIGKKGLRCLVVDDLIATGGTMAAAVELLKAANCQVVGCLALMELQDLNGKKKIDKDIPVHTLIKY